MKNIFAALGTMAMLPTPVAAQEAQPVAAPEAIAPVVTTNAVSRPALHGDGRH